MAASDSLTLQSILNSLKHLHNDNSSQLSLKQLIAVHQSFLLVSSSSSSSSQQDDGNNKTLDEIEIPSTKSAWIQALTAASSNDNPSTSSRISETVDFLLQEPTDKVDNVNKQLQQVQKRQLLCAIQSLFGGLNVNHSLSRLCLVLLPWVQIMSHTPNYSRTLSLLLDEADSVSDQAGHKSGDNVLWEVILEAAWSDEKQENSPTYLDGNNKWFSVLQQWILEPPSRAAADTKSTQELLLWNVRTTCLRYLQQETNKKENNLQQSVEQTLLVFVQQGLQYAVTLLASSEPEVRSQRNDHASLYLRPAHVLQPIMQFLLPALLPAKALELWDFCWSQLLGAEEAGLAHRWTVKTAVLCAMLPHVRDLDLSTGDLTCPLARPVQQTRVWRLVQKCLLQGIHVSKKQSWLKEQTKSSLALYGANNEQVVTTDAAMSELFRRRALYMLRILVEPTREAKKHSSAKKAGLKNSNAKRDPLLDDWNRYVACVETMEMENEAHLVDQVWNTVRDLASRCVAPQQDTLSVETAPPPISFEWMHILWARALLSPDQPAIRKSSLCRLCLGEAGLLMKEEETSLGDTNQQEEGEQDKDEAGEQGEGAKLSAAQKKKAKKASKKTKDKKKKNKKDDTIKGMPMHMVTNDFVIHVVLPSFDSLEQSVGTHLHLEEGGKTVTHDLTELCEMFLHKYLNNLIETRPNMEKLGEFIVKLLHMQALISVRHKTATWFVEHVAQHLMDSKVSVEVKDTGFLANVGDCFSGLFTLGYIIQSYRDRMLRYLAMILSCTFPPAKRVDVKTILSILQLYPIPSLSTNDMNENWLETDPSYLGLHKWLLRIQEQQGSETWGTTVASTVAVAFVDGILSTDSTLESHTYGSCTPTELEAAKAIVLLCALLQGSSQVLWPAIHKGLSLAPAVAFSDSQQADKVARALTLLEFGCQVQILSGNGNGDLIVDKKTQQMMPPAPRIEELLAHAIHFRLSCLRTLLMSKQNEGNSSRSSSAKRMTTSFLSIIGSLQTLSEGFPSSMSMSNILDQELEACFDPAKTEELSTIEQISLAFAAVSGGARSSKPLSLCQTILSLQFQSTRGTSKQQPLRSLFPCSKWGSLHLLSSQLTEKNTDTKMFFRKLFSDASDSVEACPSEGLLFLFNCIATSTKVDLLELKDPNLVDDGEINLSKVIDTLFGIFDASDNASDNAIMLNELCTLLFNQEMLANEFRRLRSNPKAPTPIRDAFRRLRDMAGTQKPHLIRIALAKLCTSWLGNKGERGQPALPYKEDILYITTYKEDLIEVSSISESSHVIKGHANLPKGTHDQSIARAFVLSFLDQLPDPGPDLPDEVEKELLHFLILRLLRESKATDGKMPMIGSFEYCRKMRSWQTLCILSRFVSTEIAEEVSKEIFECLGETMYGQIRYFVEVFGIQCARKHPKVFGRKIVEAMTRTDLNLQEVASIMVISGSLIVGRYKDEFLVDRDVIDMHALLAGATPWLSSTQGFSRAITQLLVHAIIPMTIDASKELSPQNNNWYLRSLYKFLDENPEMKRLRVKQQNYFAQHDVDKVCNAEHIFSINVDVGGEANPENMIDLIKKIMLEAYEDFHGAHIPDWKRAMPLIESSDEEEDDDAVPELNFQRKIIPLETLNLAFEEARERKIRNIAGRKKQPLIVCASLIDKVPNLGGLARSAEIFAATKLVIPDLRVTKQDIFTGTSVGAGDWIEIEECTENNLLAWLLERKTEGFIIVGVEQTSSSVSLLNYEFPDKPTVLLLGKEKEGIPVQFLHAVDQCIEIPQLGIIRSLNVHVSGAITVWEYTRQRILSNKVDVS